MTTHKDNLFVLPTEILREVLFYFSLLDLKIFGRVSKQCYLASQDVELWERKFSGAPPNKNSKIPAISVPLIFQGKEIDLTPSMSELEQRMSKSGLLVANNWRRAQKAMLTATNPPEMNEKFSKTLQKLSSISEQIDDVPGFPAMRIAFGGPGMGKTLFLHSLTNIPFTNNRDFEGFAAKVYWGPYTFATGLLDLVDRRGMEKLNMVDASLCHGGIYFYSVVNRASFEKLKSFITGMHTEEPKKILVGTHVDLRNEMEKEGKEFVSKEEGEKFAKEMKLDGFFEIDCRQQKDTKIVMAKLFEATFGELIASNIKKKDKCICM